MYRCTYSANTRMKCEPTGSTNLGSGAKGKNGEDRNKGDMSMIHKKKGSPKPLFPYIATVSLRSKPPHASLEGIA